jgi:hypothetical protein
MPKTEIDYSNTIIYKITCKDANITDLYVGHTTNFVQRKHQHKQNCINVSASQYGLKLYEVIRAHGGWKNWNMEIINYFVCKDHTDARKKEQEYFHTLNATLNSVEPLFPVPQRVPLAVDIEKTPKNAGKFSCENCDFICSKNSDLDRHLTTAKHLRIQRSIEKAPQHICQFCNKLYKYPAGLWKHKKTCNINMPSEDNINMSIIEHNSLPPPEEVKNLTSMVMELIKSNTELQKQNTELQKQMLEVCKHNNTTNNIHTNSHNKTFNLQFFLNEQCKDAMNITDFVNSFELQLSDLESVGELGYVEGITKIMVDKLNSMDIYKRPIHCSDAKREILYVKDNNKWEKEEKNNPKLRYAIKTISFRNMKLAALWSDTYPESMDGESHLNDTYIKIIKESTGGHGEISNSEDKIIRRIAKEILISKV